MQWQMGLMAAAAVLVSGCASLGQAPAGDAVVLNAVRGFHVGGERRELSGLPIKEIQAVAGGPIRKSDPNGNYQVGQLYVQQFELATPRAKFPMMMWHGGGLTGVTWEQTPDGRPGWHDFFMRTGHETWVSDAVERGRATWARYPELNPGEPEHRTIDQAWNLFRFGPEGGYSPDKAARKAFAGQQFPVDDADQFEKQMVARWSTSNAWVQKAYDALVQRACPCVILAHSQGGPFALQAAWNAPDKVKALILIEASGAPDPAKADPARMKGIPVLFVKGDNVDKSPLWPRYFAGVERYLSAVKNAGGHVDLIDLPARGIHGNSHMMMMDRNNLQIAGLVQEWIAAQGLMK